MIAETKLKKLYVADGLPIRAVADRLGTTYYEVRSSLIAHKIPIRRQERKRQRYFTQRG